MAVSVADLKFPAIRDLPHTSVPHPYCAGLDIGLASRPGRGRVVLRSVELFHYKLHP